MYESTPKCAKCGRIEKDSKKRYEEDWTILYLYRYAEQVRRWSLCRSCAIAVIEFVDGVKQT